MNPYKILFLDIDGTIMRPVHTIEESTKAAITELQQKGIETVLATGRPIHEITEIAQLLHIDSFIGYNGAYAIYKGKDIFKKPMSRESVISFLDTAKKHHHELVLYSSSKNHFTNMYSPSIEAFKKQFHLYQNEPYTRSVSDDILGMTIIATNERDADLYFGEKDINLSQVNVEGFRHCFDVIRESVHKGTGVNALLQELQIPIEASIAFGDGMNDKEMIAAVGEGFAMGNSMPELFSFAKHKTTSVMDSGVYNGLKSLGLLD
ncbi:HAD family hydrolase [Bacillus sp. V59.32b]|uniref:Cof-type HAD-IIB family hydrolase n=1 Tax=Bacillus sp. V59.32b TaxID=1758642 RepID=UPI000E3EC7AE|nr:HAD family hydrolase [Bacillus sp. V59.32b]RFU66875.1 HAD family phosphatase [Bacillus sp. V59.32b]